MSKRIHIMIFVCGLTCWRMSKHIHNNMMFVCGLTYWCVSDYIYAITIVFWFDILSVVDLVLCV